MTRPRYLIGSLTFFGFWLVGFALEEGPGWLPGWSEQLGLRLEKVPGPAEIFSSLAGEVENPAPLQALLGEVRAGDRVLIHHAGNVAWTVATDAGEIRPCVIKLRVEGTDKAVTLVPDRRTGQLRIAPPPFKGSKLNRSDSPG